MGCHSLRVRPDVFRVRYAFPILALLFACDAAPRELPDPDRPRSERVSTAPAAASAPNAMASAVATASASASPPAGPAVVEQIDVPGDLPASIVKSADGKPPRVVFLPGICSNAGAYLWGFPETARALGGTIAIDGDKSCGGSKDFRSITSDPNHEEPRILAALAAAGAPVDPPDVVLVGYSLGATLIENLVKKSPERYSRVVLIGSPRDPRLDRLRKATAVATMSCSLDVPGRMKGAVRMLENAGVASRYFEMPGCTHGNLAEADRVFAAAIGWARTAEPPAR